MTIDPQQIQLSDEQKKALAQVAEQTGKSYVDLIDEWLSSIRLAMPLANDSSESEKSHYDVLCERNARLL